jgi:hypothetical protein
MPAARSREGDPASVSDATAALAAHQLAEFSRSTKFRETVMSPCSPIAPLESILSDVEAALDDRLARQF